MKDIKETIKAVEMSIGDTTQVEKEEANMGEEEVKEIKKIGWYIDQRKQFLQMVVHMVHEKVHVAEYQAVKAFEQTKEEPKERGKRTKEMARNTEESARHNAYEML